MVDTAITVRVRNVNLLLAQDGRRGPSDTPTEFRVISFTKDAKRDEKVQFPNFRVICNLARKYLKSNVSRPDYIYETGGALHFYVEKGRSIEQRSVFLAAVAARCSRKK